MKKPHMKKRLLLEATLLLVLGGGIWGLLRWYAVRNVVLPAPTAEELAKMVSPYFGPRPQAAPVPMLNPTGPVRLAIGGFGFTSQARNGAVADLVLADMTTAKGFVLVDRQSVDKVLRELELNLSGVVRAGDALRVGKLLKADWFLFGSTVLDTNHDESVVARVVDVRTGIMRDVGVFFATSGDVDLARDLATFVQRSRNDSSRTKPRVYLAIGSFADVGVNSRQADFPAALRSYLISAYRNSDIILLERYYVDALLQEVRLDLAGMTDSNARPPPLQSAFWTVDGYFQSFETTNHQVELQLRVSRAFGSISLSNLRGDPDGILRQIKEKIDYVMGHANPLVAAPTRATEIRFQLDAGEELFSQATGGRDPMIMAPSWQPPQAPAKRRRNMEEAVRAFQTVLLLDHENHHAKFYLGACFRDASLKDMEKARNYLRETALSLPTDHWCEMAAVALARSFDMWDDNYLEGEKWFEHAAKICKDPSRAAFYHAQAQEDHGKAIALAGASSGNGPADSESSSFYEQRVLAGIAMEQNVLKGQSGGLDDSCGLAGLVQAYGANQQAAAKAVLDFLPKLRTQFPDFMPHLLAAVLDYQLDTNTPVLPEFEQSMQACREHPEKVLGSTEYFEMLLRGPYKWAMDHQAYSLAVEIAQAKVQAAKRDPEIVFDTHDNVKLAYAYMKLERWADALHVFEQLPERPFMMIEDGPWGYGYIPFLPTRLVATCREKLGLPPVRNPKFFTIGKALLPVNAFSAATDGLWVAMPGILLQLDFDLHTNLQITLPFTTYVPPEGLCVGPNKVWLATVDAGLLEMDKSTRTFTRLTQKDGLIMDQMLSLAADGNSLWLGFGHNMVGGLGKLDLENGRLSAFTPALSTNPQNATTYDPSTGPPRHSIDQIVCANGHVYVLINRGELRRYDPSRDQWGGLAPLKGLPCDSFAADDTRLLAAFPRTEQYVDLADEGQAPNLKHPRTTRVVMDADQLKRFESNPARAWRVKHIGAAPLPTIGVLDFRTGQWQALGLEDAIPDRATQMALHGSNVCLSGMGYLAIFDTRQNQLRKICYLPVIEFDRLEFAGDYLWGQVQGYLYRVPISDLR